MWAWKHMKFGEHFLKCIRGKWNKNATILFSTLKISTHNFMLIKKYKTKLFLATKLRIILNVDSENQHVLNFNCDLNWTFLLLGFKCLTIMHRNKIFFISQGFSVRHCFSLRVHVRVNNAGGIVVGKWKEFGSQVLNLRGDYDYLLLLLGKSGSP